MIDQRYTPPKTSLEIDESSKKFSAPAAEPIAIGGWLILVAIGMIISPFRLVSFLLTTYWPIFRDGQWEQLTTTNSPSYHPLWGPLLTFEIVGNLFMLAMCAVTLALFFKKSKKTPKFAIAWYAFGPVFLLIDELLGNLIPAVASNSAASNTSELVRATLIAFIWIPYFLVSDRVKKTFTR